MPVKRRRLAADLLSTATSHPPRDGPSEKKGASYVKIPLPESDLRYQICTQPYSETTEVLLMTRVRAKETRNRGEQFYA